MGVHDFLSEANIWMCIQYVYNLRNTYCKMGHMPIFKTLLKKTWLPLAFLFKLLYHFWNCWRWLAPTGRAYTKGNKVKVLTSHQAGLWWRAIFLNNCFNESQILIDTRSQRSTMILFMKDLSPVIFLDMLTTQEIHCFCLLINCKQYIRTDWISGPGIFYKK